MNNKIFISTGILLGILFTFGVFGQGAIEWIGGYSSDEFTDKIKETDDSKLHYYWQLESLKKGITPRYIRLLDAEKYPVTGKFLERGILFTYAGLRSSDVEICGNFSAYKCLPMKKNKFGIFYIIIQPEFRDKYRNLVNKYFYKFRADGFFELDPNNESKADEEGASLSEFILEKKDVEIQATTIVTENELNDEPDFRIVEFRVYKPEATMISLVGNFNHWNPELDYMKKDRDGIFSFRKKLKPGEYLYSYIIDGEKVLDLFNPETRIRFDTKEISSYLMVKERTIPYEK